MWSLKIVKGISNVAKKKDRILYSTFFALKFALEREQGAILNLRVSAGIMICLYFVDDNISFLYYHIQDYQRFKYS